MDLGRILYLFARVYVWSLFVVGGGTVFLLFMSRNPLDATLAGIWFAVGGFGALVGIIAVLIYLYE